MAYKGGKINITSVGAGTPTPGFSSDGTFNRAQNWTEDMLEGKTIDAEPHDIEDDNFASGLSECVTRGGEGKFRVNIDATGHRVVNISETFDVNTDAATTRQLMIDPSRYFVDVGNDGITIILRNKYTKAYMTPSVDYSDGYYFFVEINQKINRNDPVMKFESGGTNVENFKCVDCNGYSIPGGSLTTGGIYVVYMKVSQHRFVFVSLDISRGDDDGDVNIVLSSFLYAEKTGDGDVSDITSDFMVVAKNGTGDVSDITSNFIKINWGYLGGIQKITSPDNTINVNDIDNQYPTIRSNVKFTGAGGVVIDQSNPTNVLITGQQQLTLTSPKQTITLDKTDPLNIKMDTATSISSSDGSIIVAKTNDLVTNLAVNKTFHSPLDTISINTNGNVTLLDSNVNYTSMVPDQLAVDTTDKKNIKFTPKNIPFIETTRTNRIETEANPKTPLNYISVLEINGVFPASFLLTTFGVIKADTPNLVRYKIDTNIVIDSQGNITSYGLISALFERYDHSNGYPQILDQIGVGTNSNQKKEIFFLFNRENNVFASNLVATTTVSIPEAQSSFLLNTDKLRWKINLHSSHANYYSSTVISALGWISYTDWT